MAKIFPSNINQRPEGHLLIDEVHPGFNQVYFIPPKELLEYSKLTPDSEGQHKKLILEVNGQNNYLTIYPINTLAGNIRYLDSKYPTLESITLEGFNYGRAESEEDVLNILEDIPSWFVKDYNYGLGLTQDYRFIVTALESFGIKHLVINEDENTFIDVDNSTFNINYNNFKKICTTINSITYRARKTSSGVKRVSAYNLLAYFLGDEQKYPMKSIQDYDDTLSQLIAKSSPVISVKPSAKEQANLVSVVRKNKTEIAKNHTEELVKLKNDIELVTLETLIQKFEIMLGKKLLESSWQSLFNENPFILSLAFGFPIIKIQDQASVGGKKLSGTGGKVTDFLVKHVVSNNAAIFEIKTPSTKLLNVGKAYRDGVYAPSVDLAGSINQLLDQRYQFSKSISKIKDDSRIQDMESYSVHGVLVIGSTPTDRDEQKSFELFRGNSKDISIVTFDELLTKLKGLHMFLSET